MICSDPDCAAEFNRKMRKISKEKRKKLPARQC
nr:MAG TPA: hypothetical protein [Caudoviricetes sp.]